MPKPHGGKLVDLVLSGESRRRALEAGRELPKIRVNDDLAKDAENISNGVFSPLEGFMVREEYHSVLYRKRLPNDLPWTIPILLDADEREVKGLREGDEVAVVDDDDQTIAIMHVEEIFRFDGKEHASQVFGTLDTSHPGVAKTYGMKDFLIGGKLSLVNGSRSPYDRYSLRPVETRVLFKEKGWRTVVGFQTRNVPHVGHEYVQKTALTFVDGIFINPVVGKKKEGDFRDDVILEAYDVLIRNYYLKQRAVLAVLQTEMRYAGPREAIFHAVVRKNFGCTHFIVGRDHAGVGNFYPPYAAQEIFEEFPDLGIIPIFFKSFFYCKRCYSVANDKTCPHPEEDRVKYSGTKIREMLTRGEMPPKEMMRPEVAEILMKYSNPFVEVTP